MIRLQVFICLVALFAVANAGFDISSLLGGGGGGKFGGGGGGGGGGGFDLSALKSKFGGNNQQQQETIVKVSQIQFSYLLLFSIFMSVLQCN